MKIASLQGPLELGVDYRRFVPASKMDQASPPFFNPAHPHNIGDWFLTKVVDRLLDFDELLLVGKEAGAKEWDLVNDQCDALVLRGGNYIQDLWFARHVGLDTLRRVKIPIILFGAGLQNPEGKRPRFEPAERDALKLIHDSCEFSALRGNSTADALDSIGVTNTIVTGCPTIYWSRRPSLELRPPGRSKGGFTFRKSLYSPEGNMNRAEFEAIRIARDRFDSLTVFLQGEEVALQQLFMARRWHAEFTGRMQPVPGHRLHRLEKQPLDADALSLEVHGLFDRHAGGELVDWVIENCFFSWDISEMIGRYRQMDFVIGCRLHGNLLALANGTPAFYLTYDERTREVADLFALPSCALADFGPHVDFLGADYGPARARYSERFADMHRFLDANRLSHRLPAAESLAAATP